jgi:predicted transcriptional regulator
MVKEKVTLTLDSAKLQELRSLVGTRSLSASVEEAIEAYVQRRRHLGAVDEWLAELERAHGPVPVETLEWAARLVDQWDASRSGRRRRRAS